MRVSKMTDYSDTEQIEIIKQWWRPLWSVCIYTYCAYRHWTSGLKIRIYKWKYPDKAITSFSPKRGSC